MRALSLALFSFLAAVGLTGCELAGDLVEVGFWGGVIIVVVIVAMIALIAKMMGGRK